MKIFVDRNKHPNFNVGKGAKCAFFTYSLAISI